MQTRLGLGLVSLLLLASVACSSPGSGKSAGALGGAPGAGGDGAGGGAGAASAKFFLPTDSPTNTSAPSIEVDAQGGIHAVYPQYVRGGAFYAYCPASCASAEQMKVVTFDTTGSGTVANAMLALDAEGRPRVLLSAAMGVFYAAPKAGADFTDPASWSTVEILRHDGQREVTGEAFALDPKGRPRFVMHVYKAYLGVGQKPPGAFYVTCDAEDCASAKEWKENKISDQMWRSSYLRFDKNGVAHLATAATVDASEYASGTTKTAYLACAGSCESEASWKGIALLPAYENDVAAVPVKPSISMALTKSGAPRIVFLGVTEFGKPNISYFACDQDCTADSWRGSVISTSEKLGAGIDLVLDPNDHPRFVHTLDYNIALAYCDAADCTTENAKWDLSKVEFSSDMKPDQIFLYENCTVAAWFLHSPSLALTPDGRPRVGYQARDISGGLRNPSPQTKPDCVAGTDMTWSRLAIMPSVDVK